MFRASRRLPHNLRRPSPAASFSKAKPPTGSGSFASRGTSQSHSPSSSRIRVLAFCTALFALPALGISVPAASSDSDSTHPAKPRLSSAFSLWPPRRFDPLAQIPEEKTPAPSLATGDDDDSDPLKFFFSNMATPPGRPETLTKEEETKLKELWAVTLKVFGVDCSSADSITGADALEAGDDDVPDTPGTTGSGDSVEKKKKKPHLGRLLSRSSKKADKGKEPATSALESVPDDAANDKYGQTKDFKAAMATQTPEELRQAFWSMVKCDNPDGLLLRFLRARKWDVQKALVMMVSTMNWRAKEMDVQGIIERGEAGLAAEGDEGFVKQLKMGKSFLHGLDKEGRPICFIRVRLHRKADQSDDSLERYTIYIMETARLMLHPPVDTACVVFDMTDFSLSNMDYNPVKFMIKCFEAHYPESLGVCLVHNAPWAFNAVWNMIRGWLDPVVAGKIHFTKSVEDLEKFIPKSRILKELGGEEDWEYTYIEPAEGENKAMEDKDTLARLEAERESDVQEYQRLTRAWISTAQGDVAKARRNEIAERLRDGYWVMDKYLRARTLYDRTGVIHENGQLDFSAGIKGKGKEVTTNDDDID